MAKKAYARKSAEQKQEEIQKLLNKLNEGVLNFEYDPEFFKAVLLMQSRMPNYSFRNVMLIKAQMATASFVASFKQWKELGRNVIKGQKSLRILAPRFIKEKDKETGIEETKLVGFVGVPVFDVSQTEGDPLPIDKFKLTLEGESDEAVRIFEWTKLLAEEDGCRFNIGFALGANGFYRPSTHEIVVDTKLSGNHRAKTAVHELVHSRVHRYDSKTTAEERECVAEGAAFIICSYLGLDTSDYSFEYVRGWASDNGASLMKYGEIIQKTANQLIADYERVSTAISFTMEEVLSKGVIHGTNIVEATVDRILKEDREDHLHYYDIRHSDDNGMQPATIEKRVRVNFMGTIATDKPLPLNNDCIELSDEEGELILQAL